jgi:hypothetical protein
MTTGNVSAPLPHQPFQFRAYAAHEDAVPGVVDLTADTTPDAPRYATYP